MEALEWEDQIKMIPAFRAHSYAIRFPMQAASKVQIGLADLESVVEASGVHLWYS